MATSRQQLAFLPAPGQRVRWLPRHGEPASVCELLSQVAVRFAAYLPIYTAVVVTLVLLIQIGVLR